jgi:hypothetical protein
MTNTPSFYYGATFIRRGYHTDSYGLVVDPHGMYDYEAKEGALLAFWRRGLNKPKEPQTLVKR